MLPFAPQWYKLHLLIAATGRMPNLREAVTLITSVVLAVVALYVPTVQLVHVLAPAVALNVPTPQPAHVDAPAHFIAGKTSVDKIEPARLIASAVVIDVRKKVEADSSYQATEADIKSWEQGGPIPQGAAVLLLTGWDARFNDPKQYRNADATGVMRFPGFSIEAIKYLVGTGKVVALGIDTLSIDYGPSKDFAGHTLSHEHGLYHLENLTNLDNVPSRGAVIVVGALPIEGGSGSDTYLVQGRVSPLFPDVLPRSLVIRDEGPVGNSDIDRLRIALSNPLSALSITRDESNLYIGRGDDPNWVTIENWFSGPQYTIEEIVLDEPATPGFDQVYDVAAIDSRFMTATPAADFLWGSKAGDQLFGGQGDDILSGSAGDDVAAGLARDGSGDLFVSGWTTGNLGGAPAGSSDAFVARAEWQQERFSALYLDETLAGARDVVASRRPGLRRLVVSACGVLANFSGAPLAFAFIATLGTTGVVTRMFDLQSTGFSLYSFTGLVLAYLYFMVPLMVVTVLPALDGLRTQWQEAAALTLPKHDFPWQRFPQSEAVLVFARGLGESSDAVAKEMFGVSGPATAEDGEPAWMVTGHWMMTNDTAASNETETASPNITDFHAGFQMIMLDGSAGHSHEIYNFTQDGDSVTDSTGNVTKVTGTSTVTMREGPVEDVETEIMISQGKVVAISLDQEPLENHFGDTPIYGMVITPEILQHVMNTTNTSSFMGEMTGDHEWRGNETGTASTEEMWK